MSLFCRYARWYDLIYSGKPYAEECDFLLQAASRFGCHPQSVLDLACGTGGHGLELARRGLRVTAVDRAPEMLERYRRKALAGRLAVELVEQDLRELSLERRFDLAICMFDAVGYLTENSDLRSFLSGARSHVAPGGLLLFDFWHAAPMLREFEPVRVREFREGPLRIVRTSTTTLHPEKQLAHVRFTLELREEDSLVDSFVEVHPVRYFLPQEMRFILESTGWIVRGLVPAFDLDGSPGADDWHLVAMASPG